MSSEPSKKYSPDLPIKKRSVVNVKATHCLWFAWADPGFQGPKMEPDTNDYRPPFDANSSAANFVKFKVLSSTQWGHSPDATRHSGPNGIDGTTAVPADARDLEIPAYQTDPAFHSQFLGSINTYLNKLVMVLEKGGAPTAQNPANQVAVGTDENPFPADGSTRVFLGMHDGHEWNNNVGEITVEVTWQ